MSEALIVLSSVQAEACRRADPEAWADWEPYCLVDDVVSSVGETGEQQ